MQYKFAGQARYSEAVNLRAPGSEYPWTPTKELSLLDCRHVGKLEMDADHGGMYIFELCDAHTTMDF